MAHRSDAIRTGRVPSATSAAMRSIWPASSRIVCLSKFSQTSRHSCLAGGSTTTRTFCCASPMVRAACCGRARLRMAMRMHFSCACMARREGWSGCRRNRIVSGSLSPISLGSCSRVADPRCIRRLHGLRACLPVIRKAILRVSPLSTPRLLAQFDQRARVPSLHQTSCFRPSWTAHTAFGSSPRASGRQPKEHAGWTCDLSSVRKHGTSVTSSSQSSTRHRQSGPRP